MHADTRPALALLPVSALTQIPATSDIALFPSNDPANPAKYQRAFAAAAPSSGSGTEDLGSADDTAQTVPAQSHNCQQI
jgi:hypothetical protein